MKASPSPRSSSSRRRERLFRPPTRSSRPADLQGHCSPASILTKRCAPAMDGAPEGRLPAARQPHRAEVHQPPASSVSSGTRPVQLKISSWFGMRGGVQELDAPARAFRKPGPLGCELPRRSRTPGTMSVTSSSRAFSPEFRDHAGVLEMPGPDDRAAALVIVAAADQSSEARVLPSDTSDAFRRASPSTTSTMNCRNQVAVAGEVPFSDAQSPPDEVQTKGQAGLSSTMRRPMVLPRAPRTTSGRCISSSGATGSSGEGWRA